MGVARNVCFDPRLVPGGGAVEMAVSHALSGRADNIQVDSSFIQFCCNIAMSFIGQRCCLLMSSSAVLCGSRILYHLRTSNQQMYSFTQLDDKT